MLLATDLDGTFLGGSEEHRTQLYQLIKDTPGITLVFVTGRGLESVMPLLKEEWIPNPDYIICDVGATIADGNTLFPVPELQAVIKEKWPGADVVHEKMKAMPQLQYQPVPQQRRSSYFLSDPSLIEGARKLAAEINCDVIYSAGKFLDVLPKGVHKGSSLTMLVEHLGANRKDVLVAGDTLNDLSMFKAGFKGVAVGESEEKLLQATATLPNILQAKAAGAGGILEGIRHFKLLKKDGAREAVAF